MFQVETAWWSRSVFSFLVLLSSAVNAQSTLEIFGSSQSLDPSSFPDYYTVDDSKALTQPFNIMSAALEQIADVVPEAKPGMISLTTFVHHNQAVPPANEKYSRKTHFGTWRHDSTNCLDTRGRVLARSSIDPVQTRMSGNRCVVEQGRWIDPYTDAKMNDPAEIQIDHLVPLKNAYLMGAWQWPKNKKCWYANFVAVDYHLLAVSGHENMSKSDETPAEYMPPSRQFQCQYVKNWLKVKLAWELELIQPEVDAINDVIKQSGCRAGDLTVTADELAQTRQMIAQGSSLCKGP